MSRFLFILFLFLVLPSLGELICTLEPDPSGGYLIWCRDENGDDPGGGSSDVLDKEDCENLQDELTSLISSMISNLESIQNNLSTVYGYVESIDSSNNSIRGYLSSSPPDDDLVIQIAPLSLSIHNDVQDVELWLSSAYNGIVGSIQEAQQAQSHVQSYSCSDMTCSANGNGSYSCPCTQEFNTAINTLNSINGMLGPMQASILSNTLHLSEISLRMLAISDSVTSITNRLNAPDDRMWSELNDLYSNLGSRLTNVVYSTVDLTNLFYTIKKIVRGQDGDNPVLQISTEGVIGLYQSVFEMVNTLQNNYSASQFDSAVKYFSNTVSALFRNFDMSINGRYIPPENKYRNIYHVFTNNNLTARGRFNQLSFAAFGGVTNWFSRMELYQQAALGWFDDFTVGKFGEEQERTTESALENTFYETTNDLSTITVASSNLVTSVNDSVISMIEEMKTVQISASLPTTITIFPEYEIDKIGNFGPVEFDTTEISDLCDLARSVTSLIWRTSFWLVYVLLAVGVARVVFVLVLFVINLSKSL